MGDKPSSQPEAGSKPVSEQAVVQAPAVDEVDAAPAPATDAPEPTAVPAPAPDSETDPAADVAGAPVPSALQAQEALQAEVEAELQEALDNEVAFSWQASEYVHHHKGTTWYLALGAIVLVMSAVAAWLRSWLSIGLFVAMTTAIVVYARKPPRVLLYELSPKGVTIEGKQYAFSDLRSFGVLRDAEWHMIDLEPTHRLMPRLTLLFDDDDYEEIVGHLELHLPRVDRELDTIERLTRYLRF